MHFLGHLLQDRLAILAIGLYAVLFSWWAFLHVNGASDDALLVWGSFYQALAWFGAITGFIVSRRWGGWQSLVGKAAMAFSIGLLLQAFGQSAYAAYVFYFHIQIPYPSMGDIGYFGSIPFYIYGAYMLAKVSGTRVALDFSIKLLQAVAIPVAMLALSYFIFLRQYEFDLSLPLKTFLDFGYPLGQAVYVSIAILAFLLSRRILGGIMRPAILLFIFALVAQYICDFTFLYQASQGTFYAGGINDQMYSISYLIMSLALVYIGSMHHVVSSTYPGSMVDGALVNAASIFSKIAARIIEEQARVIGPLAWTEATKVAGLSVDLQKNEIAVATGDEKGALDRLVAQYERLFGRASQEVCREAAASLIATLPRSDVPQSLLA